MRQQIDFEHAEFVALLGQNRVDRDRYKPFRLFWNGLELISFYFVHRTLLVNYVDPKQKSLLEDLINLFFILCE